jgi:RNA polymerase-interacting CarD/CdnL/TRCF family regulator
VEKTLSTTELRWNTGDYVVYKKRGVYEISEIRTEKVAGDTADYYVLRSVYDLNATVYVPADKPSLVSQIESVLTAQQVEEIICTAKANPMEWISVNGERFALGDETVAKGEVKDVLSLMLLLMEKRQEAISTKTKFFAHDERNLNTAKRIISDAFAFPLGIDRKEVVDYIVANT